MSQMTPLRQTKIVCTIGPSCSDKKTLFALAEAGMNVARLNFSHGKREDHQAIIDAIAEYNESHDLQVATMLDTKGAEIRSGDVASPLPITKGEEVLFISTAHDTKAVAHRKDESRTIIGLTYDDFAQDVKEAKQILVDNGSLSFDILSIEEGGAVVAKAREDGEIGSRRHINLPGADIDLPSVTESDWSDIAFGIEQKLDFVALSFIRTAEEVEEVRALIDKENSTMKIISKIETEKAVKNINKIIDASDGIMVARGDLGADVPFEHLPAIQDEIVCRCKDAGKPVIIATHMLESMKEHPVPTRAEVTDVAHAVDTGADATMLSGETASGRLPLESLQAMIRIQMATEEHILRLKTAYDIRFQDSAEEEMDAAVGQARDEDVDAFVLLTDTGRTAQHISKFRHTAPIIALTRDTAIARSLNLLYGVYPIVIEFDDSDDVTMQKGMELALKIGLIQPKQKIMQLKDRAKVISIVTV